MKVAVFSDTHGSLARLPMVLAALPALDAVLHLGDFAGDGEAIAESLSVPCYAVRGNCDFRGNAPWERVAELGGALGSVFTPLTAVSFLVFTLLYTPCVAAVAAIRRELGSLLKTVGVVILQCGVAWCAAYIVYSVLGLLI